MDYSANRRYPVPDVYRDAQRRVHTVQKPMPGTFASVGARVNGFATGNALFESQQLDDDTWEYARYLGRGGFGRVGLWVKKDGRNQAVDEVAVKEQRITPEELRTNYGNDVPALEEAAIQAALQRRSDFVVQLRAVTKLVWPTVFNNVQKLRYYMEYCGGGDLWAMLLMHVGGRTIIPEGFLWHLFAQLVDVMEAMQSPPFEHPDNSALRGTPFILHMDVKPDNILLTRWDTDSQGNIIGYPRARVGDWGLAALTSELDPYNSNELAGRGTPGYIPPEQFEENDFGQTWTRLPPWRDHRAPHDKRYKYTPAHSTFSFAAIIYKLMTLDWTNTTLEALVEAAADHEQQVYDVNFRIILPEHMSHALPPPILVTNYSLELRTLIADCLHFDPAQRPDIAYLRTITRNQAAAWAQRRDGFKLIRTSEELSADRMHRVLAACQRQAQGLPLASLFGSVPPEPMVSTVPEQQFAGVQALPPQLVAANRAPPPMRRRDGVQNPRRRILGGRYRPY